MTRNDRVNDGHRYTEEVEKGWPIRLPSAELLKRYYPNAKPNDRRTKSMAMVTDTDQVIGALLDALKSRARSTTR